MKKIKFNLLPIIGMMVAVATFAFTVPDQPVVLETQYWFEMDLAGTTPTHEVPAPDPNCPKLAVPDCARLYNESQTEIINDTRQVKDFEVDNQINFKSRL